MNKRRWGLLVTLLFVVSACGGGEDAATEASEPDAVAVEPSEPADPGTSGETTEDPAVDEAEGESVTVTYWHAYNEEGPEAQALNEVVIPRFEEEHPGVTVEAVAFPYDDLRQKLITSTAGGTLPCLVRSDIIWVPELAELGVLVALDQQMPDFDELAGRTYEGTLATNLWDGTYYGLPLDTNTRVLMYNQEALEAGGMSEPPATFEDLQALAEGLSDDETFAFADNGTSGWNMLPWIWSGGGALTDEDITQATGYLNSPESVAAVEMLAELHDRGEIPDLILGGEGGIATSEGLPKATYATILDGPWMFPIFEAQYPDFDLQTALVPEGPGGSVSVVGGEDIVLTQSCEQPEAAMDVIRFMLSDFAQTEMAKVGQMPVLSDLGDQLTDIQPYYAVFAEQLQTARPRTPHPQYPKIEEIMNTEIQRAFRGEVSVQEALDGAAEQIDQILASG